MSVFGHPEMAGHEQVVYCENADTGLRAIIAIHDTTLGPALGGLRMWPYASEHEALTDVLRLARGMTYKNALAGLNHGGGKAVVIGDPRTDRTEARMRSLGRFIDALGGRYITAEDVGMTERDMEYIFCETDWVVGTPPTAGGGGDPSPFTAQGVIAGIRASLRERYGHDRIGDCSYVVQGVGHVGEDLVRRLREHDAEVTISDIDAENAERVAAAHGCATVAPEAVYDAPADVFCPCALGGVINAETLPRLRCDIVAGAANNQLADNAAGDALHERGIVYAPDYAINAGGVMNVSLELEDYSRQRAQTMVERIEETLTTIYERARADHIATWLAADRVAEGRIAAMGVVRGTSPATPARLSGARRRRG
jgi:leucine dehydrogenase